MVTLFFFSHSHVSHKASRNKHKNMPRCLLTILMLAWVGASEVTFPTLTTQTTCSADSRCQACQGDCDIDNDCASGFQCMQRNGDETVKGCGGSGLTGYDYCRVPPCPGLGESMVCSAGALCASYGLVPPLYPLPWARRAQGGVAPGARACHRSSRAKGGPLSPRQEFEPPLPTHPTPPRGA